MENMTKINFLKNLNQKLDKLKEPLEMLLKKKIRKEDQKIIIQQVLKILEEIPNYREHGRNSGRVVKEEIKKQIKEMDRK